MSTHKYKYPEEFLKIDQRTGKKSLKKNKGMAKKINEWRRTHNYDGTQISSQNSDSSSLEDIDDSAFQQIHEPLEKHEKKDYLVDEKATRKYRNKKSLKKKRTPRSSSSSTSSYDSDELKQEFLDGIQDGIQDGIEANTGEMVKFRYSDLNEDLKHKISHMVIDDYVFDDNGRILTPDICQKMRNFCELNPRTCYLEREFLTKYVKVCQMIYKTSLYVDAFYDRTDYLDVFYLSNGPSNSQPWRQVGTVVGDPVRLKINNIISRDIPKSQMPNDTKQILINVIGSIPMLSGGVQIDNYQITRSGNTQLYRNDIRTFVRVLSENRDLMELMVQMWREGMSTQTKRKPKQIEEIIRRFIRNL